MTRSEFLASLVGRDWDWQNHNCWTFAGRVQRELFGRELPAVQVPETFSRRYVLTEFNSHPERARWAEIDSPNGIVIAADGALVLMSHLKFPAHIGVWLKPEGRVIHCDKYGVVCEPVLSLRQMGWRNLTFFEPI